MFKQIDGYISNKDEKFLKNSDLIIGWNKKGDISFEGSEKLILLLARLAYVFELVCDEIKKNEDYDEFIDILRGIRIKKILEKYNYTLPEIADILSRINDAKKVSILINEEDYDTIMGIIGFGAMIGFDKIGLYFDKLDEEFYKFRLVD